MGRAGAYVPWDVPDSYSSPLFSHTIDTFPSNDVLEVPNQS